jgi:hypothetical protein
MDVCWCDRAVFGPAEPWPQKTRTTLGFGYPKFGGIAHVDKIQTMGRRGYTCSCPISGDKYLMNPFQSLLSRTNRHQGTGNIPDHVMQKRIGLHVYYDKIPLPGYRNPLEKPNGCSGLAASSTKRGKIVLSGQYLGRLMHAFGIEWAKGPAYLASLNTGTHRVVIDDVTVTPVSCGKSRVEIADTIPGPVH